MTRFLELAAAIITSLGVFYTLALHAIWFPIFKGTYVRAQNITSGDTDNLIVFAGTDFHNLLITLGLSITSGILIVYIGGFVVGFVQRFFSSISIRIGGVKTKKIVD